MNSRTKAIHEEQQTAHKDGPAYPLNSTDPRGLPIKSGAVNDPRQPPAGVVSGHENGHDGAPSVASRLCRSCGQFVTCAEDHHGWCVWALGEIAADRSAIPVIVHGPRVDSPLSACGGREARKLAEPDPVTGRRFERVTSNWNKVTCEACLKADGAAR